MDRLNNINPFAKRDDHSKGAVITYKTLTTVSWLLSVIASVYYSLHAPRDGTLARHTIWGQQWLYPTGFTLNSVIAQIYWVVLFVLQGGYLVSLFSSNIETVNAACAVGSHFIFNNLLHFAFVMLFVRSYFAWAELILIVNFFNLTSLYFRHNKYPRFIHTPTVSGPLAWTFVAIYWNGALMVHRPDTLVARIFANIFVWGILVYGGFFIVTYKDYTMGFALSVLSASLGVAQFQRQVIALQWIFSFTIMAVLFLGTLIVAVPATAGSNRHWWQREEPPPQDAERAPLLHES